MSYVARVHYLFLNAFKEQDIPLKGITEEEVQKEAVQLAKKNI